MKNENESDLLIQCFLDNYRSRPNDMSQLVNVEFANSILRWRTQDSEDVVSYK